MSNIVLGVVCIIFELSATFAIRYVYALHTLYLLPRFLGYFIIVLGCKALNNTEVYSRRKPILKFMTFFETVRWFIALFWFSSLSTGAWFAVTIISVCGMLYTLKTIADSALEIEGKYKIEIGAADVKKAWRLMLVGLLFVFSMKSKALYIIVWIFSALFGISYCKKLAHFKNRLMESLPYNVVDEYK